MVWYPISNFAIENMYFLDIFINGTASKAELGGGGGGGGGEDQMLVTACDKVTSGLG